MDYRLTGFIRDELIRTVDLLSADKGEDDYDAFDLETIMSSVISRLLAGNFVPYEPKAGDLFSPRLLNKAISTFRTDIGKVLRMEKVVNVASAELYNSSQIAIRDIQSRFNSLSHAISEIHATRSIHVSHIVDEFNNSSMIDVVRSSGFAIKNGVLMIDTYKEEVVSINSVSIQGNGEPGNNFQSYIEKGDIKRTGELAYNGSPEAISDQDALTVFEYESCKLPLMVRYRLDLQSAVGVFNYANRILDQNGKYTMPIENFTGGHGLDYTNGKPWYKRPGLTIFDETGEVSNFNYANWLTKDDFQLWQGVPPLGMMLTFDIGDQIIDTILISTPVLPYKGFTPPYISSVRGMVDGNIVDLTYNATFLHLNETSNAPGASAMISFSPIKLRYIFITLVQPNSFSCLLAHKYAKFMAEFSISMEQLTDTLYRYEKRIPTALHKYGHLDQLERLSISDASLSGIIDIPDWAIPKKAWTDVGFELMGGKRWCIPIRDISFYHRDYKRTMDITSVPFLVNGARNVRVNVDYDRHGIDANDLVIKFSVSFDDKAWHDITPMNGDGTDPQVYYINTAPDEDNAVFIRMEPHPSTVRFRITVINKGSSNYSPTFYNYELLLDSDPYRSIPILNYGYHDLVLYVTESEDPFYESIIMDPDIPGSYYSSGDTGVDVVW